MTELFGFQAGQRLAEKDNLEQQLGQMSLEQGQQSLKRGDIGIQKDQVDLENAKLTQDRQTEFLKLLKQSEGKGQGGSAGTPASGEDLATRLDNLAEISMKAGLPEQGGQYGKEAANIRNNSSLIKSRENDERNRRLTYAAGLLDRVTDEGGWQQANMLYSIEFGEASPFANLPFTNELVGKIKDSVTSQRQKSLIEAATIKAEEADAQLKKIQSQTQLNKAKTVLTVTREKNLEKAGDKTPLPKAGDLKAVSDLITKEYGSGTTVEDIRVLSRPIAERMVQLQKELNIPQSEAAARAFKEAQDAGDLGGLKENRKKPGSKESPLTLPSDAGKYKKNMYYTVPTGKYAGRTALYTGKPGNDAFEIVE